MLFEITLNNYSADYQVEGGYGSNETMMCRLKDIESMKDLAGVLPGLIFLGARQMIPVRESENFNRKTQARRDGVLLWKPAGDYVLNINHVVSFLAVPEDQHRLATAKEIAEIEGGAE